jgi:hypothetical protein
MRAWKCLSTRVSPAGTLIAGDSPSAWRCRGRARSGFRRPRAADQWAQLRVGLRPSAAAICSRGQGGNLLFGLSPITSDLSGYSKRATERRNGTKKMPRLGLGACRGMASNEMVVGFDRRGGVTKLRLTILNSVGPSS